MGKSGKSRCLCDKGWTGRACQMDEAEKEEMKQARVNAMKEMKEKMKTGKISNAKDQKEFMKSVLADNDDEVDIDPETADALVD